jgi:hypothetical protein
MDPSPNALLKNHFTEQEIFAFPVKGGRRSPSGISLTNVHPPEVRHSRSSSVVRLGHVRIQSHSVVVTASPALSLDALGIFVIVLVVIFLVFGVIIQFLVGFTSISGIVVKVIEVVKVDVLGLAVIPEVVVNGFLDLRFG